MTLPLFAAEDVAVTLAKESEFHPTPEGVLSALLNGMREAGHEPLPLDGRVRESAAGEGALAEQLLRLAPSPRRTLILHELRAAAANRMRSLPGDLVCDPTMGSGTTLVAAEQLGRRAVGIDRSEVAIRVARARLAQMNTGVAA